MELFILPEMTCVSSFHKYQDSNCTNDEHTNNTKANNQRQGCFYKYKENTKITKDLYVHLSL